MALAASPAQAQNEALELRYTPAQLECAQFLERAESDIRTQASGRIQQQTTGRRGVWRFRAGAIANGLALEGWLDTLSLWRKSRDATVSPDTDGLLGGRYRGKLSNLGAYVSQARPFVPDEVAEVAGMGTVLDDFFPPLPQRPLRAGQAWTDSAGVTVRRMADSGMSGVPLYRFEVEIQRDSTSTPAPKDSISLRVRQASREHGTFIWHPTLGLIRRDRRIVVETSVPAGGTIRQPVRSRISQRITVLRDLTIPPEQNGHC